MDLVHVNHLYLFQAIERFDILHFETGFLKQNLLLISNLALHLLAFLHFYPGNLKFLKAKITLFVIPY